MNKKLKLNFQTILTSLDNVSGGINFPPKQAPPETSREYGCVQCDNA